MLNPDQANIRSFRVIPSLPEPLRPLLDIANNLWWTWHPEAVELFVRIDRKLWSDVHHNPVRLLGVCPQERLDQLANDHGYLTSMKRVEENFQRHVSRQPWHKSVDKAPDDFTIAYFCAEFGLTECFQIYSGGLGGLAGDHVKSAAALGLPFIGVGLLYRRGYFQQYLNAEGWQQEYYPDLDFANLPVSRVKDSDGQWVKVAVELPGREVHIGLWKVKVGRVTLYLLDTNLQENDPADRGITSQLYGGDMELRIKQEVVLGIGGTRALSAIGIKPDVCHMNEGHSAFLALERIKDFIAKYDVTFDEARQAAAAGHVFTTHTPVPAGIDRFPPEMIQRYFKHYHHHLRLDMEGLLALGRENVFNKHEFFSMAVLALRTADWANGVSRLHGKVSRSMWNNIFPGVPEDEVPIGHVTNGVHARSWLSGDLTYLLDRYLGERWQNRPADLSIWKAIQDVPDEELWRVKDRRRQKLILWTRKRLQEQLVARGTSPEEARSTADALDPRALTIGFARRFATYKRGTLLLRDAERLMKMLSDHDRPIQFLIAGKAHPADGGGKDLIRTIVHFARESDAGHKIVFIENYDIQVARQLVQGCDVWLNTPRRGMEASGTSGMKAAMNGVLNCSVLDGWWDEAYENDLGWAIGRGETYANIEVQDDIESKALYDLFEKSIIPIFYGRDEQGIPRAWVRRMKQCITKLAPVYNTNRMVQEYARNLYIPAANRARKLKENNLEGAIALAHKKHRLRGAWNQLRINQVNADTTRSLTMHEQLPITATVHLGELSTDEVRVQAYAGVVDGDGQISQGNVTDLVHEEDLGDGNHLFAGSISIASSGRYGFAVRIVPGGPMFDEITEPGLIFWDGQPTGTEPQTGESFKIA